MNIMLFSNGKIAGNNQILEYGFDWIAPMMEKTKAKKLVFIPYAVIRGSYDERTAQVQQSLAQFDCEIIGIHTCDDPVKAVEEADGIVISGGNTWVLNRMLHDNGLISAIRTAVIKQDKLFIGWSAGTNVATPTIRTTNDMPIISAAILPSLNLVPFQINPHYIDGSISGHMGETRDERIEEFLVVNPSEVVVGIPEGAMLQVDGETLTYHSANDKPLKLFKHQQEAATYQVGAKIQFLMEEGA